nr:granzyme-like protein 1 [Penaeus vannamei]
MGQALSIWSNPLPVIEVPTNGTYEFTEGPLLPGQRIVGGHEADPYKYGYQACVTDKANFYCGGSIIKDNIVLTAAHCMLSNRLLVIVGQHNLRQYESSRQEIRVLRSYPHPHYGKQGGGIFADIVILKLEKKIKFNDKVFPIQLPDLNVETNMPVVVTWGELVKSIENPKASGLQVMKSTILPYYECLKHYGYADVFCAIAPRQDVSACSGDSGGPAMSDDILIGVVSFAVEDCPPRYSQAFINLYYHREWLMETIEKALMNEMFDVRPPSKKPTTTTTTTTTKK